MKTLILFMLTSSVMASVIPDRSVTPPLDLFSSKNKTLPNGDIQVKVTTYNKTGLFVKNGGSQTITKNFYEAALVPARAVYEMIPSQSSGNDEAKERRGTAFHIGHNLVLTNNHVLDPSFKNTKKCSDFRVKDHNGETFDCKKVHYCNPDQDVCLIEMKAKVKTVKDCFLCKGKKVDVALADGPTLSLFTGHNPDRNLWDDILLTAIGNSEGYGIHFSQGRGMRFNGNNIYFFAPITKGNSGGPLLNDENMVVGVVKRQSQDVLGNDPYKNYNVAARSEVVVNIIREALKSNAETLEQFNQAVVE